MCQHDSASKTDEVNTHTKVSDDELGEVLGSTVEHDAMSEDLGAVAKLECHVRECRVVEIRAVQPVRSLEGPLVRHGGCLVAENLVRLCGKGVCVVMLRFKSDTGDTSANNYGEIRCKLTGTCIVGNS